MGFLLSGSDATVRKRGIVDRVFEKGLDDVVTENHGELAIGIFCITRR